MPLSDYSTGTLCWAKLQGYPWWPARIEDEASLTPAVRRAKPRSSRTHPVFYFGSLDYSWVSEDCLENYQENYERFTSKQRSKRDSQFNQALAQAKDPAVLEKALKKREQLAKKFEVGSDEESDNEASEVDSGGEREEAASAPKIKRGKKRTNGDSDTPKTPSKRQAVGTRKASSAKTVRQTAKVSSETPNNKDKRGAATTSRKRKTNGADEVAEPESPTTHRSEGAAVPLGVNHDNGAINQPEQDKDSLTDDNSSIATTEKPNLPENDNPYIPELRNKLRHRSLRDCLMFYRHKIQKTLLKDQNPGDLAYIDAVFHEMELVSVDLALLKDTKVFKLMKRVVQTIRIDPDQYHLRDRALALVHKWRQKFPELVTRDNRDSGSPAPASTAAPSLAQQTVNGAEQDQSVPSSASPTTAVFQPSTSPSHENNAAPHSEEPEADSKAGKSDVDVSVRPVSPTVQDAPAPTLPNGDDKAASPEHHASHVEPAQPSAISS
ncbi:hypothetical protein IWQ62_005439 [Dispira parvispora]|uniref:PWWP domain-containing protein n=1 Tax=Dispira parvispora TaxID=1520584 RepID=A0A9W8AJR7_9FUNG|nr:hypothetical protein IWQ62_005439 [Dispira parvispora]